MKQDVQLTRLSWCHFIGAWTRAHTACIKTVSADTEILAGWELVCWKHCWSSSEHLRRFLSWMTTGRSTASLDQTGLWSESVTVMSAVYSIDSTVTASTLSCGNTILCKEPFRTSPALQK